jgi:hypothetical protein
VPGRDEACAAATQRAGDDEVAAADDAEARLDAQVGEPVTNGFSQLHADLSGNVDDIGHNHTLGAIAGNPSFH